MQISKKCQYALKAVFELAMRDSVKPVKVYVIAGAQNIPPRFLEVILNQLRHSGLVESQRGKEGGYRLARHAQDITVSEVLQCIQGPMTMAADSADGIEKPAFPGDEAFKELWQEVNNVICEVCDTRTFADLVAFEKARRDKCALNYSI